MIATLDNENTKEQIKTTTL